jgi:hypothetical protein
LRIILGWETGPEKLEEKKFGSNQPRLDKEFSSNETTYLIPF